MTGLHGGAAFAVREPTDVSAARRAAGSLAGQIGLGETRAGRVALIVTELGTNLLKHARRGEILLRRLHAPIDDHAGIEVIALDHGPGIQDPARSRTDGFSTAGSLGQGLGAIERLSDAYQLHTEAGGTTVLAHVWQDSPEQGPFATPRRQVGCVQVSRPGESVCGDQWTGRSSDGRLLLMLADGLGHGPQAHEAARRAIDTFEQREPGEPLHAIQAIHTALGPTRGAAVAALALDDDRAVASFCGIGNISAAIVAPDGAAHKMVSMNGTAGHHAARLREFEYVIPPRSIVVMHSDGISTQWDLAAHPGVRTRHPSLIAAVLYRAAGGRRDDATVLVVKERAPA